MKDLLKIAVIFGLLLLAIPLMVFAVPKNEVEKPLDNAAETSLETKEGIFSETDEDIIKVLDFTSGQVMEIAMQDYVTGAVLAEMPASYHEEALKAQAVAARTYAVRQREKQRANPDELLMGADISNDSTKFQAYFTPEQAKAFYGDSYDTYYNIVYSAVESTKGEIMMYGGEPIVAAFHSTSGGITESAEIIWGNPIEYLVPVDSAEDENSPVYLDEKIFTEDEISACIHEAYPDADFSDAPEKWIVIGERSRSGTVIELSAGGEFLSGTEFRQLFSLRSANFDLEYSEMIFASSIG